MIKLLQPFLTVGNFFVKRILKSRFHRFLSHKVVLLEVVGQRSGKTYLVPVNYIAFYGGISVMTYRRRKWWRNIRSGEQLTVHLQGDRMSVHPEVITEDHGAIAAGLVERGWMRKSIAPAKAKDSVLIRLHFQPFNKPLADRISETN